MTIKFLVDHKVDGSPEETFKAGQVVKDRSPESELGFVRRRVAGFVGAKGVLTDHEGQVIVETTEGEAAIETAEPDRRDEGPRSDGTPPRALPGPRTFITSVTSGDVKAHAKEKPAAAKPKATPAKRSAPKKRSSKGKASSAKASK